MGKINYGLLFDRGEEAHMKFKLGKNLQAHFIWLYVHMKWFNFKIRPQKLILKMRL